MTPHPWMPPSAALVAQVARGSVAAAFRQLATVPVRRLGTHAAAWPRLLTALPKLLRTGADRLCTAVCRVDVLPVLIELGSGTVEAGRLERALVTLWLGIAGHPGMDAPLALPGPFRERVVDPSAPRLLEFGNVRGLAATARGPVVLGTTGQMPIEKFVVGVLPCVGGTVIVDERLDPPAAAVVARLEAALTAVGPALPGGRLERITVGAGTAAFGEARVSPEAGPAELVAAAQAAFTRAAALDEPLLDPLGRLVEHGWYLSPVDILARASGNAVALPWRTDRAAAAAAIAADLENVALVADLTPAGTTLTAAIGTLTGATSTAPRRALLVNVDAEDFIYSFQFGQSVERRCVERGLCVDRIAIDGTAGRDLAHELGYSIPVPCADGAEFLVASDDDPGLPRAIRRLAGRRYEVVVANVRPRLFYDLVASDVLAVPTLVWDRHLHDGLTPERARRGSAADRVRHLPIRLWSLLGGSGAELERGNDALLDAGLEPVGLRPWPMDLDFFRSAVPVHPNRLFAGGDSRRDWPLFVEAIRGLPFDVHLVTAPVPAGLPAHAQVDERLPLWRFRDAMAAAAVTAIPLAPGGGASGLTVLTMAMALGVAVVATASPWMVHYVTDGEEALLVPPGDVRAFREALVSLSERDELRARLVANARRRVAALCDLDAFTREMFSTVG